MIRVYLSLVLTCLCYYFVLGIRDWGEDCSHSDECYDHRMVCLLDNKTNVLKCACDRFHVWNGSSRGCIQIYSASYILNKTDFDYDSDGHIEKLQEFMYRGPVYSIYFMIFVIASCVLTVILYCVYVRTKDSRFKSIIFGMITRNETVRRRRFQPQPSTSQC